MIIPILFAAAVVFVICIALVTYRLGARQGGREWAIGWVCAYVAGVSAAMSAQWPVVGPMYPFFGTMFAGLLFLGAARFADVVVPRWLLPAMLAVAFVRAGAQPFSSYVIMQAQAFVLLAAGSLAATRALASRRGRADATAWETALGWSLPLIPLAQLGMAATRVAGRDEPLTLVAWFVVGLWTAGLQAGALLARAARRAEHGRATLATLVDAVPAGLALGDPDGRIRATNPAFAEILGEGGPNSLVGRPFLEIHRRLRRALDDPTAVVDLSNDETQSLRLHDGRLVLLDTHPVPGQPNGRLWLLRDVTEERRLAEALDRSRRLETLGRLAGGVAHDFNNKLTVILGGAALLRPIVDRAEPRRRERLDDLETAAQYCADLTRDLLDFAKKSPRAPTRVEIGAYLDKLIARLRRALPRGIHLTAAVAPGTPPVEADPLQLERVITNLVQNARDALGSRGNIEIQASPDGRDTVALTVKDDGPGMDVSTRERAFDPFFTTKGPGGGTGLGLAIVLSLVESNGGEVTLSTSPGGGAAFRTSWPRYGQAVVA